MHVQEILQDCGHLVGGWPEGMREQGLVSIDTTGVQVTALGWYFVRALAMVFDRYLQTDRERARFSRIL